MQINDAIINEILVLTPMETRIEAATIYSFKGQLVDWINKGREKIVLDLTHVGFVDSSGLGAIISTLKSLGDGGELLLVNPQKSVMNMLKLTRMNRVLKIFNSIEEALSYFENKD